MAALFQARELTLPVVLLSVLAAMALGAPHALSPGHGKTVMAAYLVGSRGTVRQAVGLGLTVTVSHTIGVLVLGGVSLSAAAVIPPERLYPILGLVSGAIVVAIGAWLVLGRIRAIRAERAADHSHLHPHDHEHAHEHDHDHHEEDGWHSHGGLRHTHVPPRDRSLGWRGLFGLGLAGGMVPSVSALILLLGSIAAGRPTASRSRSASDWAWRSCSWASAWRSSTHGRSWSGGRSARPRRASGTGSHPRPPRSCWSPDSSSRPRR
jgi:ABC-type nickel/cobalt efflux system permease component RcnA